MKIKHWQGYGTVEAVKVKDFTCDLHIKVTGNHEYGLERNDTYDVFRWLVKRFKRNIGNDDRIIENMKLISGYEKQNGISVEVCDYYINFKK